MSITYRYADIPLETLPERFNAPTLRRNKLAPLHTGDVTPDFSLPAAQVINAAGLPEDIHGRSRPLVVAFISFHWNGYAEKRLQELRDLYADIQVMGGDLLVLSDEDNTFFNILANKQPVPFPVVWDRQHKIASQFGIYSTTDPIWDRISGVNEDVPTPGIFVLNPNGKIVFDSIDLYFEKNIPVRDLLSAVYTAGHKTEKAA
ncbi:redoxin domain-containing protein [Chitinophaga sp. GbtcB8]|uniref:redoxin domain-containing protein n=1 Tax=Chitinophaga sp. GbtcB8 TaxID=2824753 RepID=UPI001C2F2310|nr:redoxin domain-containing protein [Chitinophaga sp. GbtcB8]